MKAYGTILAYPIAGHHAGLSDYEADETGRAALSQRLLHAELLESARRGNIPADILNQTLPKEKPTSGTDPAFWIRLLFSCLVDADFLDTEDFLEPAKAAQMSNYPKLTELMTLFSTSMKEKQTE